MRLIGRKTTAAAIAAAVLGVGGLATAQSTGRAETDRVTATFNADFISSSRKPCTGQDGEYVHQVQAKYTGAITSTDPRLTGQLEITTDSVVRDTPDGDSPDPLPVFGTVEGHVQIKQGGEVVTSGLFSGVVDGPRVEGFITGRSKAMPPEETFESGELFAHFNSTIAPDGDLVGGTLGGPDASPNDPGVIQSGNCPGPTEEQTIP